VAIDVMREVGLTHEDVRARVSDRRLLQGVLAAMGVPDGAVPAVFAAIDKIEREPRESLERKLAVAGVDSSIAGRIFEAVRASDFAALRAEFGNAPGLDRIFGDFARYQQYLDAHGVLDSFTFDLSIVRGLAYYTGIVFELFDAKGELRAICGGGRYDSLLQALGGVDLPALGFGMGDVVLTELLRARNLLPTSAAEVDYWVVPSEGIDAVRTLRVVSALRGRGFSVDYVLNPERLVSQKARAQMQTATKAGAHRVLLIASESKGEIIDLKHEGERRDVELENLLDDRPRPSTGFSLDGSDPLRYCLAERSS
jgi:histidyl-tRNA synthetase